MIVMKVWVVVLGVLVVGAGYVGVNQYSKAKARQAAEVERVARAAYVENVRSSLGAISGVYAEFADANMLAGQTPRVALAVPITRMQDVVYRLNELKPFGCSSGPLIAVKGAMKMEIIRFTAFMGNDERSAFEAAGRAEELVGEYKSLYSSCESKPDAGFVMQKSS